MGSLRDLYTISSKSMGIEHSLYHPKGKGLSLFIAATDTGKNNMVFKKVAKSATSTFDINTDSLRGNYTISSRSMMVEHLVYHPKVNEISLAGTGENKMGYLERWLSLQHQR